MSVRLPISPVVPDLGDFAPGEVERAFRRLGGYVARMRERPVLDESWRQGQIAGLASDLPLAGEGMAATLDFYERVIAPGIGNWNNPNFMGFFGVSAPLPGVAAAVLTNAHNANRMVAVANPAAPELDFLAAEWLRQALHVSPAFQGQLFYSASQSHLHALCAAMHVATGGEARTAGVAAAGRPRIYRSELAHFFTDKNAITAGIGLDNVVLIPTDETGAMSADALAEAMDDDIASGFRPLMVVATVGTTSTNAVDPVSAISDVCKARGVYLYVDAAYGGAFAALPEFAWIREGWDRADAICINPHKQLMTPLGCSALFLKDRKALVRTFARGGAYIPDHVEPDPQDYTNLCGMPMNALPVIMTFKAFGVEGLRARLRNTVRLADLFQSWIGQDPAFEVAVPNRFSTVCFRALPAGITDLDVIDRFNATLGHHFTQPGPTFLSPTRHEGRLVLRLTVGNIDTDEDNVRTAYEEVRGVAERVGRRFSFRWLAPQTSPASALWSRMPERLIAPLGRAPGQRAA